MNASHVFLIAALAVIIALCAILFIAENRDARKKFKKIAAALGGDLRGSLIFPPRIEGRCEGARYSIRYKHAFDEHSAPSIRIRLLEAPKFQLSLRQEDFETRISKKIRLSKETKIGVPDFDDRFFIKTNDESHCINYLLNPDTRDLITRIYENGWLVRFTTAAIEVSKRLTHPHIPLTTRLHFPRRGMRVREDSLIQEQEIVRLLRDAIVLYKNM